MSVARYTFSMASCLLRLEKTVELLYSIISFYASTHKVSLILEIYSRIAPQLCVINPGTTIWHDLGNDDLLRAILSSNAYPASREWRKVHVSNFVTCLYPSLHMFCTDVISLRLSYIAKQKVGNILCCRQKDTNSRLSIKAIWLSKPMWWDQIVDCSDESLAAQHEWTKAHREKPKITGC